MVHPPMNVVMLSLVALWGPVVAPGLLLRSLRLPAGVGLDWSIMKILGATARIVTKFTTLETNSAPYRGRVVVPQGVLVGVFWWF